MTVALYIALASGRASPLPFILLLKITLVTLDPMFFHIKFRTNFSMYAHTHTCPRVDFDENCNEFIDQFGESSVLF